MSRPEQPESQTQPVQALPPWRPLLRGAREREGRNPQARWLQLATVAADGSPRVRTLVFRGWGGPALLDLLTDGRSSKAAELQREPRLELCWLLPKARCQFRLRGALAELTEQQAQAAQLNHWQRLRPEARALWAWPPPGEPLQTGAPFPAALADGTAMPAGFQLLQIAIERVELLELTGTPHRRRSWCAREDWLERALNPLGSAAEPTACGR